MKRVATFLAAASLALAANAFAQGSQILHVSGHSFETGGFPPSNPGDQFQAVGDLNDIDVPLVWDTANYSYTFHVRQLVSVGEVNIAGTRVVGYTGGLFTIYVDWLPSNGNYGINPPNGTSPSTFSDGISTYLDGFFSDFTLTYNDITQSGSFTGTLNFTGGDVFPLLSATNGWTFGANLAGVSPTGYDLQLNGDVFLNVVGVEESTWGGIKALYQ
jgi:hypothetical protein